jgi:hypothetical protein
VYFLRFSLCFVLLSTSCTTFYLDGFEQMMAGLNARAIDYAKIGKLDLEEGMWEGREIVPWQWVGRTTEPAPLSGRRMDGVAMAIGRASARTPAW